MQLKHLQRLLKPNLFSFNKNLCVGFSQSAQIPSERYEAREKKRQEIMARGLPKVKPIPDVKNIILVASGKGGVGKSTTAAKMNASNLWQWGFRLLKTLTDRERLGMWGGRGHTTMTINLATALKTEYPTKNIGLLDTDVFGPTVPQMMNLNDTPMLNDNNLMEPLVNYGVKCMSMGFLIEETAAVIWRGLMVMQALEKLMRQIEWGPTDVLIIDTPPGTGDTQLSLIQNLPITGVILITTPQNASIQVTRRGAKLFDKLNIPIIGLVENMSSVKCPACLNDVQLFGNGVKELAEELDTKVLLSVPLDKEIGSCSDKGVPVTISKPNSNEAISYRKLANITNDYIVNIS